MSSTFCFTLCIILDSVPIRDCNVVDDEKYRPQLEEQSRRLPKQQALTLTLVDTTISHCRNTINNNNKREQEYALTDFLRGKDIFTVLLTQFGKSLILSTDSVGDEKDVPHCFVMLIG